MPVPEMIVATDVLLLLHMPPEGVLERAVLLPEQTVSVPAIAVGSAFTVTTAVVTHPLPDV